jgi:hypothetical protein
MNKIKFQKGHLSIVGGFSPANGSSPSPYISRLNGDVARLKHNPNMQK